VPLVGWKRINSDGLSELLDLINAEPRAASAGEATRFYGGT